MKTELILLTAGLFLAALANGLAQPGQPAPRFVEGELLVKFKGGSRGEAAAKARNAMKHAVRRNFDQIGWQQIRLPTGMTVAQGIERYRNLHGVLAVEPNFIH